MSDIVLGDTIVRGYTIWDTSNDPLTGMTAPTDVVFYLHRESSGTMVAASETVTLTEIGSTGHYYISFTPENTGAYRLQVEELNASTNMSIFAWDFVVHAAGAVFLPSYSNAFCAESDIERWLQQTISSTTAPDDTETAGFAETRAAILMSICARFGLTITPSTVTSGSRLEDILREANAIGAAMDYTMAQQFGKAVSLSDRWARLRDLWMEYVGTPTDSNPGYLILEVQGNLASLATDHIISGDTNAYPEGSTPTSQPIGIGMGDLF